MKYFAILSVTLLVNSCAFGMGARRPVGVMPERNCPRSVWEMQNSPCIQRLMDDGSVEVRCPGELGYPEDLISITFEGYNCERNYQDLLINKCREYKP